MVGVAEGLSLLDSGHTVTACRELTRGGVHSAAQPAQESAHLSCLGFTLVLLLSCHYGETVPGLDPGILLRGFQDSCGYFAQVVCECLFSSLGSLWNGLALWEEGPRLGSGFHCSVSLK